MKREELNTPKMLRRVRLDLNTPAELAIFKAMQEVEKAGADVRLTEATMLLAKAKDCVADFIDGVEQSIPPAEGAEEIIESILESLGDPINIHNHAFEIRPYTVDHKRSGGYFIKKWLQVNPLAQWLGNFAALHAQQIADKMVEERLRDELIKYDKYVGSRGWIDNYEDWTAITSVDEYLKQRQP